MSVKRKVTAPVGNRSAGMTKDDTRADSTNIVLAENVTIDVPRRRLVALAVVVTVLLAVVAVAARGRLSAPGTAPAAGCPGPLGLRLHDVAHRRGAPRDRRDRRGLPLPPRRDGAEAVSHSHGSITRLPAARRVSDHAVRPSRRLEPLSASACVAPHRAALHSPPGPGGGATGRPHTVSRHAHFRWEELVVVLGLLVALGVVARASRSRLGPGTRRDRRAPEVLAAALDASLDDLRTDPDLRRAIVAAYARMETALAAAGLPRHPAGAPLEYVERALLSNASADAVRRLTDLFEWARFSQHEPEPSMRDEAVDALVAVRDELRAAELTLA